MKRFPVSALLLTTVILSSCVDNSYYGSYRDLKMFGDSGSEIMLELKQIDSYLYDDYGVYYMRNTDDSPVKNNSPAPYRPYYVAEVTSGSGVTVSIQFEVRFRYEISSFSLSETHKYVGDPVFVETFVNEHRYVTVTLCYVDLDPSNKEFSIHHFSEVVVSNDKRNVRLTTMAMGFVFVPIGTVINW